MVIPGGGGAIAGPIPPDGAGGSGVYGVPRYGEEATVDEPCTVGALGLDPWEDPMMLAPEPGIVISAIVPDEV